MEKKANLKQILCLVTGLGSALIPTVAYAKSNKDDEKTFFGHKGKSYTLLQDGGVIQKDNPEMVFTQDKEGNWFDDANNDKVKQTLERYMPQKFEDEIGYAEEMARQKEKVGIKALDSFQYYSPVRKQLNTFVVWDDGTITLGPYEYNKKWFYQNEDMHDNFNEIANQQLEKILKTIKLKEAGKFRGYPNRRLPFTPDQTKPVKKELQKDNGLHLILDANVDTDFNNFGGTIGLQYTPFKELGFSILGNFNKAEDRNLLKINEEPLPGYFVEGSKDEIDSFSIGPSLEIQAGPLFIGGGFNYWKWIESSKGKIMRGDLVLNSDKESIPQSQIVGNVYAGLEHKFKNFGLGAKVGYDFKEGPYLGARTTVRLNRPRRESKK